MWRTAIFDNVRCDPDLRPAGVKSTVSPQHSHDAGRCLSIGKAAHLLSGDDQTSAVSRMLNNISNSSRKDNAVDNNGWGWGYVSHIP